MQQSKATGPGRQRWRSPKGGVFEGKVEQGRYGPIFPKSPACYGFSILAKVIRSLFGIEHSNDGLITFPGGPLRANDVETITCREFTLEGRGRNIPWLCLYH